MLLSIEPEAMRLPVGSNLAAKISPEWPVNSITGAWRPLVRGALTASACVFQAKIPNPVLLTLCNSALLEALMRARAPSEARTFCLLTRLWDEPGSSSAGRFSADILGYRSDDRTRWISLLGSPVSFSACEGLRVVDLLLYLLVTQGWEASKTDVPSSSRKFGSPRSGWWCSFIGWSYLSGSPNSVRRHNSSDSSTHVSFSTLRSTQSPPRTERDQDKSNPRARAYVAGLRSVPPIHRGQAAVLV